MDKIYVQNKLNEVLDLIAESKRRYSGTCPDIITNRIESAVQSIAQNVDDELEHDEERQRN
jgi:hypothetical protein